MSYHKQGNTAKARGCYEEAARLLRMRNSGASSDIEDVNTCRAEAEAVLAGQP